MNPIEHAIDAVLVLRCQAGDRRALERLFERHYKPLRYYLRRLLECDDDAGDAQQDVWVTVMRTIRSLRNPDAFQVWLYRIARNTALKKLAQGREFAILEDDTLMDANADPESIVFSREDAAGIHRCLGRIAKAHREVLVLRFIQELSYESIAEVTGCAVGTVRSRLFYAKQALRQEMEKDHD